MSPMTSSMPVDAYRVITDEPVGDVAGDSGEEVQTPAPSDSTEVIPKDGVLLLVSVPRRCQSAGEWICNDINRQRFVDSFPEASRKAQRMTTKVTMVVDEQRETCRRDTDCECHGW